MDEDDHLSHLYGKGNPGRASTIKKRKKWNCTIIKNRELFVLNNNEANKKSTKR
jgi:hypothetical protein